MNYIYIDESGCLGFDFSKLKTSNWFVLTALFVTERRPIERIVKKVYRKMLKRKKIKHSGVLHCTNETDNVRKDLLRLIAEEDIQIVPICMNKKNLYPRLHEKKHEVYNYVTRLLIDRICERKLIRPGEPVVLIASKRETNKYLNQNFESYLERQLRNDHDLSLTIRIKTPSEDKCLQVVDFLCWSIFRKYERNDDMYYRIIERKIISSGTLFHNP